MSGPTAMIAREKVTILPAIIDIESISDVVLEQVFHKVSHEPSQVGGKQLKM
jgi:hypothetical protein